MDPRIVNSSRKGYKTNKCMYPVYTVLERRSVRTHAHCSAVQAVCTTLNVSEMAVLCAVGK